MRKEGGEHKCNRLLHEITAGRSGGREKEVLNNRIRKERESQLRRRQSFHQVVGRKETEGKKKEKACNI